MNGILNSPFAVWTIAAAATLGVIARPFRLSEAVWAVLGAVTLCLSGSLPWSEALHAIGKGTDVYLFLTGMMVASELARKEGLFDYMAAFAAQKAAGSGSRLFFLLYCVGTVVTMLMSNDATAVVLTPAVLAVARAVRTEKPLPYLYICAFVANAASFALPISNPANLVIFRAHMPALAPWLTRFALPSVLSIVATYAALRFLQRAALTQTVAKHVDVPRLCSTGKTAGWGITAMAIVMLGASVLNVRLGWPTFAAGVAVFAAVCLQKRKMLWGHLAEISWALLPLVGGLFVLVEGLQRTRAIDWLARSLHQLALHSASQASWLSGIAVAVASNLVNNLPAGLIAGSAVAAADVPNHVASAILIGVDLGPNLSVTGSLATILWLTALRREGIEVGPFEFLKLGFAVMLPALIVALAALQFTTIVSVIPGSTATSKRALFHAGLRARLRPALRGPNLKAILAYRPCSPLGLQPSPGKSTKLSTSCFQTAKLTPAWRTRPSDASYKEKPCRRIVDAYAELSHSTLDMSSACNIET